MQTRSFLEFSDAQQLLVRVRVRLLQIFLLVIAFTSIVFTLRSITNGNDITRGIEAIATVTTLFALGFLLIVSRGQLLRLISTIVVSYMIIISIIIYGLLQDQAVLLLLLSSASLAIALLTNRLYFWLLNVIMLVIIIITSAVSVSSSLSIVNDERILTEFFITLLFGLIPLAISVIARYFTITLEDSTQQAQRSTSLLIASADIGRNVSEMLDLNVLLDRAVEIVRDRFAFYHVSVFLADDNNRYVHLTASTGDVGERMLARGHRLLINADSVVGRAAQAKDVIVARDTDRDSGHSFNELLPLTRSELAVPIIDNEGVVGVLDMQSRRIDAFTATERDALTVIANQLATAIRNARLFEDKERNIRENKRLFIEAETNLREIQRLNRQLTKQAWSDYLRTDRRVDGVTLNANTFKNSAEWSDEMDDASRRRRAITNEENGLRKVTVPIELRGEVVGAIEVETHPDNRKDDLADMIRTVSQRLAVSLDNARLFEESNEATAQEQRVSEIVSQYQSVDSVDDLLRVTIQGLAETLGAEHASIRLGFVPDIKAFSAGATILPDNPHEHGEDM
ncbi:MAG: GAF domain-containing protein [Phototrophicaceae bacterium]